jgi:hypothetical protein
MLKTKKTITETKIINNKKEFGEYLINLYGFDGVRSALDDLICHEA